MIPVVEGAPDHAHAHAHAQLLGRVAQVGYIDATDLAEAVDEILSVDVGYRAQYAGYNDGHWLSAVLVNPSGRQDEHILVDGVGRPTELAAQLPHVTRMVDQLAHTFDLEVCWARLALMEPQSQVWEHRDFLELHQQDKVRLHVPLITNPKVALHFPRASVHFAAGFVWHLATDSPHAASNGGPARVHLIVDCNDATRFAEHGVERWLDEQLIRFRPKLEAESLSAIESTFRERLAGGDRAGAERLVLGLFGSWDLGDTTTYRLLARFHRAVGADERAAYWLREETDKLIRRLG